MIYETIDKQDYLTFHETLEGKDKKFSKTAIGMWDFMKAWDDWGVRVLKEKTDIISVCFMKVSGQAGSKVLFISNIFTPEAGRGKGSARNMLDRNIKEAFEIHSASTIRLDCNRPALPFYDKLGMTYWGTTISESMFCDLPINNKGVDSLSETKYTSSLDILNSYSPKLREAKIKWIKKKVIEHEKYDYGHPSRYEEFVKLTSHATLEF
jgi:predicted GNAT family N-acyltransferase